MDELSSLSLSELREALEQRGFPMALNTLSEFLATDDVAAQLGVGGKGNRLEIPPIVADILAEFLPRYKAASGRKPQRAAMLRSFLQQRTSGALVPVSEFRGEGELTKYGDNAIRLLARLVELQEAQPPPDDALLTPKEASARYGIPGHIVETLRFKIGRRWYVKRSSVLKWIQEIET